MIIKPHTRTIFVSIHDERRRFTLNLPELIFDSTKRAVHINDGNNYFYVPFLNIDHESYVCYSKNNKDIAYKNDQKMAEFFFGSVFKVPGNFDYAYHFSKYVPFKMKVKNQMWDYEQEIYYFYKKWENNGRIELLPIL